MHPGFGEQRPRDLSNCRSQTDTIHLVKHVIAFCLSARWSGSDCVGISISRKSRRSANHLFRRMSFIGECTGHVTSPCRVCCRCPEVNTGIYVETKPILLTNASSDQTAAGNSKFQWRTWNTPYREFWTLSLVVRIHHRLTSPFSLQVTLVSIDQRPNGDKSSRAKGRILGNRYRRIRWHWGQPLAVDDLPDSAIHHGWTKPLLHLTARTKFNNIWPATFLAKHATNQALSDFWTESRTTLKVGVKRIPPRVGGEENPTSRPSLANARGRVEKGRDNRFSHWPLNVRR